VDAGTAIAEDTPPESPGSYRLRMSRVFPTRAGGAVDGHVYVRALGPPDQAVALQKIVHDIRAITG
jgi:hypothetical protein